MVREGLLLLAACHGGRAGKKIVGLGKFSSGIRDLGSNKARIGTVKPVLLDTGVIVAWLDRSEGYHQQSTTALKNLASPLVTCEAVIAESCYLLRHLPGAPEAVQIAFQLSRLAAPVRRLLREFPASVRAAS